MSSSGDARAMNAGNLGREGRDAVTAEILRNAFYATVRQASRIILRSSFSPIIRDAFDFCVTLVGPRRPPRLNIDVVAMNESLAHFSGVMPYLVRNLVWEYGIDNLEPGDLIALNNPYKGGNHIYDNAFFKPIFHEGEFLGGIAAKAHLMDMGGVSAGGYSVEKRNIWEEGVVIAGIPVYKRNQPFVPGFNLYFDNSRLPDNMLADLQALFSACTFGEERLLALADKYGRDVVEDGMVYTLDYAEESIRKGIGALPDGDYEGEDGLDADAFNDEPYRVRCRIKKRGERIEVDFSGSSRAAASSINCSTYDTANGVYTALKFLCDPNNPNNSGAFRSIDVLVPEGSFIGALPPAPTTMYFDAAEAIFNAVVKALLPALGDDAFGGHFSTNMGLLVSGSLNGDGPKQEQHSMLEHLAESHGIPYRVEDGTGTTPAQMFIAPMFALGAFGASMRADGENYVSMSQQNIMDMSTEAIEEDYPIMVVRREFAPDFAGPGQHRGGAGVVFDRVVLREADVRPLMLHMRILPWGSADGEPGRPGGAWFGPATDGPAGWVTQLQADPAQPQRLEPIGGYYDTDGRPVAASSGQWYFGLRSRHVEPNTYIRVITPGGGGWGDPFQRHPEAVLKDVRDGFVTVEGARRDYGVVVTGDPNRDPQGLAVDPAETERLRARA